MAALMGRLSTSAPAPAALSTRRAASGPYATDEMASDGQHRRARGRLWRRERIEPQVRRATDAGLMSPAMTRGFARLLTILDERVGPIEPPARLHGDLWGGNLMCDDRGALPDRSGGLRRATEVDPRR